MNRTVVYYYEAHGWVQIRRKTENALTVTLLLWNPVLPSARQEARSVSVSCRSSNGEMWTVRSGTQRIRTLPNLLQEHDLGRTAQTDELIYSADMRDGSSSPLYLANWGSRYFLGEGLSRSIHPAGVYYVAFATLVHIDLPESG